MRVLTTRCPLVACASVTLAAPIQLPNARKACSPGSPVSVHPRSLLVFVMATGSVAGKRTRQPGGLPAHLMASRSARSAAIRAALAAGASVVSAPAAASVVAAGAAGQRIPAASGVVSAWTAAGSSADGAAFPRVGLDGPSVMGQLVPIAEHAPAGTASNGTAGVPPPPDAQYCFFECGSWGSLINMGNARSVRMVCNPCFNAKRALDGLARRDKAYRKELDDMKKFRIGQWKHKVRSCRIRPLGLDSPGVVDLSERDAALATYEQEFAIAVSVKAQGTCRYLDRDEYIAHQMYKRAKGRQEAEDMWAADLANPGIRKFGTAEAPRIPVHLAPQVVGESARTISRSLSASTPVLGAADLQAASARMCFPAMGVNTQSDFFADVGGRSLAPGAASGSASGMPEMPSSAAAAPITEDTLAMGSLPGRALGGGVGQQDDVMADTPRRSGTSLCQQCLRVA